MCVLSCNCSLLQGKMENLPQNACISIFSVVVWANVYLSFSFATFATGTPLTPITAWPLLHQSSSTVRALILLLSSFFSFFLSLHLRGILCGVHSFSCVYYSNPPRYNAHLDTSIVDLDVSLLTQVHPLPSAENISTSRICGQINFSRQILLHKT